MKLKVWNKLTKEQQSIIWEKHKETVIKHYENRKKIEESQIFLLQNSPKWNIIKQ